MMLEFNPKLIKESFNIKWWEKILLLFKPKHKTWVYDIDIRIVCFVYKKLFGKLYFLKMRVKNEK